MAKKFSQRLDYLIERASYFLLVLAGILTILMVLATTYGVFRRYALNSPEPYSYELSIIFLLFISVLAISAVDRQNQHIRVDMFSNLLPRRIQNILLNIISPILGLFYAVLLTWQGWNSAWRSLELGEVSMSVWAEPLFPIKVMIPIGYGVLCLVLLARLCRGLASLKGNKNSKLA